MTIPMPGPLAVVLTLLTLAVPTRPVFAQDPAAEKASGWLPILRKQADEYEIIPRGGDGRPLRPLPEPLLRWTQPVRGGDDPRRQGEVRGVAAGL